MVWFKAQMEAERIMDRLAECVTPSEQQTVAPDTDDDKTHHSLQPEDVNVHVWDIIGVNTCMRQNRCDVGEAKRRVGVDMKEVWTHPGHMCGLFEIRYNVLSCDMIPVWFQ